MKECCEMRGFLSYLVLRLVSKRNVSGEEIREELKKRKGSRPSPGTVYPALKTLKRSGLIEEIKKGGRVKKYRLTKKGKIELERATRAFCHIFYDMREDFQRCCK